MKITKRKLESWGACPDQVERFAAEWPRGGEITRASLARAAEMGLNLEWLAERVLQPAAQWAHETETAAAWRVYDAETAAAGRVLQSQRGYADASAAWRAYAAAVGEAWRVYDAALAAALADALGL